MSANVVYVAQVKQVAIYPIYILYFVWDDHIAEPNNWIPEVGRRGTLGQIARPK